MRTVVLGTLDVQGSGCRVASHLSQIVNSLKVPLQASRKFQRHLSKKRVALSRCEVEASEAAEASKAATRLPRA